MYTVKLHLVAAMWKVPYSANLYEVEELPLPANEETWKDSLTYSWERLGDIGHEYVSWF